MNRGNKRFGRQRRGRGRGNNRANEGPGLAKVIRHPADPPEIREQLVGQRWVRVFLTFTTAGLHQIKISDVIGSMFSDASEGRGAFYLHRLRVYSPQLTSDTTGTTPARLTVPNVVLNVPLKPLSTSSTFPFQRFVDQGMTGSARSCCAVEMPKFWQDFPLSVENNDTILVEMPTVIINQPYIVDMFVTISYSPEASTFEVVMP